MNAQNNCQPYTPELIFSSLAQSPRDAMDIFGTSGFGFESILNDRTVKPYYELIKIVCEHLDPYFYPFVTGDKRDKMLNERLQKFYIRYIGEI